MIQGLSGAGIFIVLCFVLSWAGARIWCLPKRKPHNKVPGDFGMENESVTFSSHNNTGIKGWFIPAQTGLKISPVIILAHGWSHNASKLLPIAAQLNSTGFSVLLYDARGHGISEGDGPVTIFKITQDVVAAVDYLETRPDINTERIGVLGHSIGGSAAILAASSDSRIQSIVSCSGFADPTQLTRETIKKLHIPIFPFYYFFIFFIKKWIGTSVEHIIPWKVIHKVKAPLLLVHGDSDGYIKPVNLDILYERSNKENTKKVLIPGAHHSDLIEDRFVIKTVIDFFIGSLL